MLESMLAKHKNASQFLPKAEVRKLRNMANPGLPDKAAKERVEESLVEIPKEEFGNFKDWIDTFCIPLRGIIEELHTLSMTSEAEHEEASFAPHALGKNRKKHKKKGASASSFHPQVKLTDRSGDKAVEQSKPQSLPISPRESVDLPRLEKKAFEQSENGVASEPPQETHSPKDSSLPAIEEERGLFEDTVSQFDDAPLPIKPESGASEHALDRAHPEDESITEIIVPGRVKRKDREAEGRRVYNARQMQRLLRKYGWERGHDGNHPTFVSPEGTKVSVPIHGGSHTIAKGTANAIVSQITNRDRTQYLIEKIEKRIQGNFKK